MEKFPAFLAVPGLTEWRTSLLSPFENNPHSFQLKPDPQSPQSKGQSCGLRLPLQLPNAPTDRPAAVTPHRSPRGTPAAQRCDPGWDGERCERCVPTPGCVHGSCQQPWQCSCEAGWAGRFCDKDLHVCWKQQPCQNGATCVMEDSGEYSCLCPEGFHGRNCQLKTGPCHQRRSPCKNGGLCEDANGFATELTCRCLA
ncbi:hypothetical protein LDENG_00250580, partial [Lucifuga dentata]